MDKNQIDPRIYDLYDEYCHTTMPRREFLRRAAALPIAAGAGVAMAQALLPDYAHGQDVQFTDDRIKATYVEYDSPGGSSGSMRGYLVRPARGEGPFPAVVVIHENRGLNPYIEDVARRLGAEGFLALAPDGLSPVGGYPGNDDDGKVMQKNLDKQQLYTDMLNSAKFVKNHPLSTGKLGATGFCYGGGVVNGLAVDLGDGLDAAAPFYGMAPASEDVAKIKAAMVLHFAETDDRINAARTGYEAALKANGADYALHVYPGTRHGFHNYSTPRYDDAAAKLAWERTVALFKRKLA